MTQAATVDGSLMIQGDELKTETLMFDQAKLKFYVDNPRIYSIVKVGKEDPSQDEIFDRLLKLEHVRELAIDIKSNGGLLEAVLVKPETLEVLEGNSRLAAYRLLAGENAVKWRQMKCTFLPRGMADKTVFALLAKYHITGKKDWSPYEQAGFVYRRYREHGLNLDEVAKEAGLKAAELKLFIKTYEFMQEHDADAGRWSYYTEFVKSQKIAKAREQYADFDDVIVEKIKKGEISKAVEVRDVLPKIVTGPPRLLQRFVEGQVSFLEAYERIVESGADNTVYRRMNKFRQWLVGEDVKQILKTGSDEERKKVLFEVNKIFAKSKMLLEQYKD